MRLLVSFAVLFLMFLVSEAELGPVDLASGSLLLSCLPALLFRLAMVQVLEEEEKSWVNYQAESLGSTVIKSATGTANIGDRRD